MDTNREVINMINAIRSLGLEAFVRDFNDERGFMWASDQRVYDIGNAVLNDGHSGCSLACTLRECQYLFNHPSELLLIYNDNNNNNNNEPDIISENVDDELGPEPETGPEIGPETEYEYIDGTHVKNSSGKDYIFYEGMDNYNREAMDIAVSKGMDAAVAFMTKDVANGNMSYAEMRSRYG